MVGKPDVGISVGIVPDTTGARVIKTSLDEITKQSAKAEAAAQRLATSQLRLVASNNSAQAAFAKSTAQIKAAENAMRAAQIKAEQLDRAQDRLNQNANKSATAFGSLKGIIAGYIGVQTILNTIKLADQYTLINARLKEITGSTRDASVVMGQLRTISNQTGTEISTSLNILQRLSFVRNEIKATNDDMVNFTSTVTKLGVISGASQDAMKFGLTQLGQSLSSQIVRAEEFNSIMENIPAVGVKIAEGLGVTTGQLRQLVIQGKLLSSDVFAVLLNQTDEIAKKFEEMPMTASRGLQVLKNDLGEIVNSMNDATNGASVLGRMLAGLGDGIKVVYLGLTSAFEYIVALIMEAVNGFGKLINTANRAGAWASNNLNPFGDRVTPSLYDTYDTGTFLGAANDNVMARKNGLFTPAQAVGASAERPISQDYAKIAATLKTKDKEAEKAAKKAATEAKRQQQELESAIKGSRTEMERLNDEIEHLEKLKGVAKTTKEVELLNRGIANTQAEIEKLRVKAELDSPLVKTFKDVADEIQDGFKDAFKSAFEGGGSTFDKFAEGIKKSFKSLLLDMAYQAAVKPIIVSVLTTVGGGLGISGGALNSILGTGSAGSGSAAGGTGGIGNLLSMGSGLLNGGLYSQTLGGIGNGIGNFLAGNGYNFIGPAAPGSLASIGAGALGNMGYGAIGGLAANLLGLGGGTGGMIGGTLGTLAGGAIGTSLGTILGMAGGPVGAIIGSFAGTALGGLFGGNSTPSKYVAAHVAAKNGQFATDVFGQDEADGTTINAYKELQKTASDALNTVLQSLGATVTSAPRLTFSSSGKRDGGILRVGVQGVSRLGDDISDLRTQAGFTDSKKALEYAILTVMKNSDFSGVSEEMETYFKKAFSINTTLEGALTDVEIIKAVLAEDSDTQTAKAFADAIVEVNKRFDDMIVSAGKLGLPLEKVNEVLEKQREAALAAVKAQEDTLKAQKAGFNGIADMTRAFDDFFNAQALGQNSTLTPQQKLEAAQSNFGTLLSRAQGGDLSVTPDLLNAANTLISQGRDVFASSVDYSNLEGFVRSSVGSIATQAGYTGQDVTYSIISTNQQLVATGTNTNVLIESMKAELFRLSNLLQSYVNAA